MTNIKEQVRQGMLTPPQVAEKLGVTSVTVKNWIKAGKLEAVLYNNHFYYIHPEAVRQFQSTLIRKA